MRLGDVRKGELFKIVSLPQGDIKAQATRLGMSVGARFSCEEAISGGPVIIKNKAQQIAIGRKLANDITVEVLLAR